MKKKLTFKYFLAIKLINFTQLTEINVFRELLKRYVRSENLSRFSETNFSIRIDDREKYILKYILHEKGIFLVLLLFSFYL